MSNINQSLRRKFEHNNNNKNYNKEIFMSQSTTTTTTPPPPSSSLSSSSPPPTSTEIEQETENKNGRTTHVNNNDHASTLPLPTTTTTTTTNDDTVNRIENNEEGNNTAAAKEQQRTLRQLALKDEFYLRYYVGHRGKFGHEYLQFAFHPNGLLTYTNNSEYRKDGIIHKECYVTDAVLQELRKIVIDSKIMSIPTDDELWPKPDEIGKQELEIVLNNEHISLVTRKIGASTEIREAQDREGLMKFYYLVQDLKAFTLSLIRLHFKIKPL
jgi:protein mago nashi